MDIIAILSLIIGVLAFLLTLFITIRTKQINKHELSFDIGLHNMNRIKSLKKYQSQHGSSIIYGSNHKGCDLILFALPIWFKNEGVVPINNVKLVLNYPRNNFPSNSLMRWLYKNDNNNQFVGGNVSGALNYSIIDMKICKQISFDFQMLRPKEAISFGSPVQFLYKNRNNNIPDDYEFLLKEDLGKRLKVVPFFNDFCVIEAGVFCDELEPIRKRFNIYWFDTNSREVIKECLDKVLKIIWNGELPPLGIYYNPSSSELMGYDYWHVALSSFEREKIKGKTICVEDTYRTQRTKTTCLMPRWNYYEAKYNQGISQQLKSRFLSEIPKNQKGVDLNK